MKTATTLFRCSCFLAALLVCSSSPASAAPETDPQPAVAWLQAHRLSEETFIRLSREPGTVVLEVSDGDAYRLLHVVGARHLTRAELEDAEAVSKVLPDKEARVLIYENNNYRTVRRQFETNQALAVEFLDAREWSSENLATYLALLRHGYQRVYELAPYVRIDRSQLPLVANVAPVDLDRAVGLTLLAAPAPTVTFLP